MRPQGITVGLLCFLFSAGLMCRAEAAYFTAKPFIASDRSDTTDFSASLATAPGSPFAVKVNADPVSEGTYAGVSITPKSLLYGFQNISFSLSGPGTTKITVHSQRPGQHAFNYSWAPASDGTKGTPSADGYQQVTLDASQLHIVPGSAIDRLVISAENGQGSFLVKDIVVNRLAVAKNVSDGTEFYKIVNGAGRGPIEPERHHGHLPGTTALTSVSVTNSSGANQTFYVDLVALPNGVSGITNVKNIVFTGATEAVVTSLNSQNTLGSFPLNNGDTATFTPPAATPTFSANFYVNSTSAFCPGNTTQGVGATLAEVTINVDGVNLSTETADISEVNGVNALYLVHLPPIPPDASTTNYPYFFDNGYFLANSGGTVTPYGTFASGQLLPVASIANSPGPYPFIGDQTALLPYGVYYQVKYGKFTVNVYRGNLGVYPFGCDVCVDSCSPGCGANSLYPTGSAGACTVPAPFPSGTRGAQQIPLCQLQRYYAYSTGGTVAITLQSPYPYNGQALHHPHH